jgi:hypothetical protein
LLIRIEPVTRVLESAWLEQVTWPYLPSSVWGSSILLCPEETVETFNVIFFSFGFILLKIINLFLQWTYSQPSVSLGSASMDSTNCGQKIFKRKNCVCTENVQTNTVQQHFP